MCVPHTHRDRAGFPRKGHRSTHTQADPSRAQGTEGMGVGKVIFLVSCKLSHALGWWLGQVRNAPESRKEIPGGDVRNFPCICCGMCKINLRRVSPRRGVSLYHNLPEPYMGIPLLWWAPGLPYQPLPDMAMPWLCFSLLCRIEQQHKNLLEAHGRFHPHPSMSIILSRRPYTDVTKEPPQCHDFLLDSCGPWSWPLQAASR